MPIDNEPRQFIDKAGLETFWADVQTFLTRNYKTLPAGMQFSQIYQLNGQLHVLVEPFGGSTTQRKEASRTSLDVYSKDEVDAAIRDNGEYIGQKSLYELNHMPHEPHNGDSVNVKFGPNDSEYIDPETKFGIIYNLWDGVQGHSSIKVLDGDNIIYDRRALTHVWDRQTGNYKIRQESISVSMDTYETVLDIFQDENGNIAVHKKTIPTATVSQLGLTTLKGSIGTAETDNETAATPKAVRDAIDAAIDGLDVGEITFGQAETVSSISETDGKISVSKQAILAGEDNIDTGAVTEGKIATGAVTTGKLDDKAVTTGKIADGAVTTDQIGDKAVTTAKIDDGAVTTDQLGDSAVTTDKIANGAVTTDKLDASGGIDGSVLKDRSIDGVKIKYGTITGSSKNPSTGSVDPGNIAQHTITGFEIAEGNNGVDTNNIVDHAITTDKLHNASVNTAHIIAGAVTTDKLYDGAVTTDKLGASAVTEAKIAAGAVTTGKIADHAVTTDKLDQQAVTTGKIADDAVTTGKILDGNITTAKIADGNVTTVKIADDAVTTEKIADANVTTDKIADANVTEGKLATDAVTTDKIKNGNVTEGKLANEAVTTEKLASNAVTPAKVSSDTYKIDIDGTAKYATHASGDLATELNSKADKVTGATNGHLAGLDASGNLADSGVKPSDFKTKQEAVDDPAADGSGLSFIDSITQDENGEISSHKKTVQYGTTTQKGVVQLQGSIGTTESENGKAATPKAVRDAIDNLDSGDFREEKKVVRAVNVINGKVALVKDQLSISDIDQLGTTLGNKADKVVMTAGHAGNFAGLDATGNLTDSGSKAADFVLKSDFDSTIQGLKLDEIGGTGYYISTISQTDGKLAATAVQMDTSPTENSKNAVTSDGVYLAIDSAVKGLDSRDSAVTNQFVTSVDEIDGKIRVTREQPTIANVSGLQAELNSKQNNLTFEGTYSAETNPVATVTSVTSRLNDLVLSPQGGTAGNYISQIAQEAGQVSVIVSSTSDHAEPAGKVPVNGTAVNAAITSAIAKLDVPDISGFGASKTLATLSETDGKISAGFQDLKVGTDNINSNAVTSDKIAQNAVTTVKIADNAITPAKVSNDTYEISIRGTAAYASDVAPNSDLVDKLDAKEDKSNKVQSMNSSSTGLTTEYPSAQAVVDFVNSSIATNTANFLGNKDIVTDLGLTPSATNQEIAAALGTYVWPSGVTPTNNDYVFVTVDYPTSTGVDEYRRFKYNGSNWQYEYTLNNSSFTQAQWNTINSGLDSTDKTNYDGHLENTVIHVTAADKANWNGKADLSVTVTNVAYDTASKTLTKTVNGTTSDVVSVSTLKTDMSLDHVDNTTDLAKPISTATQSALDLKEDKANKVTAWSSTTSDTNYPSEKLVKDSLDNKVDKISGKGLSTNDYTTAEKDKLAGIEAGAEVNQNAFSSVTVGMDTIQADTKTDTLTLVAGSNVQLAADTATDTVTISATDTTYGADRGISLVSGMFGHSNAAVTGAPVGPSDAVTGVSVSVPRFTFDGYGHVTAASDKTFTVRTGSTSQTGVVQLQGSIGATESEDGKAATPKAVRDAINALDVASVGGSGNVIVSISEENGKISATAGKLSASGGALSYSGEIDEDFCLTLSNVVFAD